MTGLRGLGAGLCAVVAAAALWVPSLLLGPADTVPVAVAALESEDPTPTPDVSPTPEPTPEVTPTPVAT
ncbi:MAG TPA: hypothetical protein VFC00_13410, partial [Micromonosporaceae bacterium]|nr:hypothetical protein [Micromonosporaceae bacterium]